MTYDTHGRILEWNAWISLYSNVHTTQPCYCKAKDLFVSMIFWMSLSRWAMNTLRLKLYNFTGNSICRQNAVDTFTPLNPLILFHLLNNAQSSQWSFCDKLIELCRMTCGLYWIIYMYRLVYRSEMWTINLFRILRTQIQSLTLC